MVNFDCALFKMSNLGGILVNLGQLCWFFAQNEVLKACTRPCFDKKMITKVYLRRDYLVSAVLQVLYFSSILFRDEESSC